MTKQSVGNVNLANSLMKETNRGVEEANEAMIEITASMEEITKANAKTSQIIKSIDEIGNEEEEKFVDVRLVSLDIESYISKGISGEVINDFDVIFRKCKEGGVDGFKLVATNPGQVFYHIDITNYWPIAVDKLTIYANFPSDFVMKGSGPIHIFLDGAQITGSCIIADGAITIFNIPSGSVVEIVIHLDYHWD